MKQLIIVCDENTKEFGSYLLQLVSANDDKEGEVVGIEDGTVSAVIWTDKQYLDNAPQVASGQHVLFIGKNKASRDEMVGMDIRFDKFGMKYGWRGKRGLLLVDEDVKKDDIDDFVNFCAEYEKEVTSNENSKFGRAKDKLKIGKIAAGILFPPALVAAPAVTKKLEVKTHQNKALTLIFYLEGLRDFLEE